MNQPKLIQNQGTNQTRKFNVSPGIGQSDTMNSLDNQDLIKKRINSILDFLQKHNYTGNISKKEFHGKTAELMACFQFCVNQFDPKVKIIESFTEDNVIQFAKNINYTGRLNKNMIRDSHSPSNFLYMLSFLCYTCNLVSLHEYYANENIEAFESADQSEKCKFDYIKMRIKNKDNPEIAKTFLREILNKKILEIQEISKKTQENVTKLVKKISSTNDQIIDLSINENKLSNLVNKKNELVLKKETKQKEIDILQDKLSKLKLQNKKDSEINFNLENELTNILKMLDLQKMSKEDYIKLLQKEVNLKQEIKNLSDENEKVKSAILNKTNTSNNKENEIISFQSEIFKKMSSNIKKFDILTFLKNVKSFIIKNINDLDIYFLPFNKEIDELIEKKSSDLDYIQKEENNIVQLKENLEKTIQEQKDKINKLLFNKNISEEKLDKLKKEKEKEKKEFLDKYNEINNEIVVGQNEFQKIVRINRTLWDNIQRQKMITFKTRKEIEDINNKIESQYDNYVKLYEYIDEYWINTAKEIEKKAIKYNEN